MTKTTKQLVVVVLLSFIVTLAVAFLLVKLIGGGINIDPDSPAMSEDAIAERLKPVGQVNVVSAAGTVSAGENAGSEESAGGTQAAASGATGGATQTASAAEAGNAGEQVYNASCQICHGTGIAGAPKVGDKAVWSARISQGIDVLYASAINGKNTMPPKGGAMSTSDADISAAVDFMVSKSR